MAIEGSCAPRFDRVSEEFERNFTERDELGASLCVMVDGEIVVDLWGGVADAGSGKPWDRDTVQVICSATKGATALCGNMLIDRGQLNPDKPVADYWPEFGKNGKDQVLVRQIFSHQSGVYHWGEQLPDGAVCEWSRVVQALEDTAPFWPPGTRQGYHCFALGYLVGELVRRIDGRSLGTFFADEVAQPMGLDFWIGLPSDLEPRVATTELVDLSKLSPRVAKQVVNRKSLVGQIFSNDGGWIRGVDRPEFHAAELPAAGGVTNGRGLAGMYAPLAGDGHHGVQLVSPPSLARMRTAQSASDVDIVVGARTSYTMGFSKSWSNPALGDGYSVIIGEDAFGTPGMGGQIGFADPSCRMAFGYTTIRHGFGTGLNARSQSVIDATYQTVGSPTCEPGFWVRPSAAKAG